MATRKLSIIYLCRPIRKLVKKHLLSKQLDSSVEYNLVRSSALYRVVQLK